MKKNILTIFLLFIVLFLSGCYTRVEEDISINELQEITLTVGDKLDRKNISFIENQSCLLEKEDGVYAINPGETIINIGRTKYFVTVNSKPLQVLAKADQILKIGDTTQIEAHLDEMIVIEKFLYESTDENVVKVDLNGKVTAVGNGLARIRISELNTNSSKDLIFLVMNQDEKYYEDLLEVIYNNKNNNIDLSTNKGILEAIINFNEYSLVGISGKRQLGHFIIPSEFGSGIIYKMNIHYKDGTVLEDVKKIEKIDNIEKFEYFVITNRHLVKDSRVVKIYIGDDKDEIEGKLIQYDDKIDLAVVSFESKYYFPTAKFGNSDAVEKGEFIVSIGNGTNKDDFRSHTIGVVSAPKRYINTDTDNDMVNDWDSEYIQHDAALNECDSGGAIINMKGEIIGINSTKIVRQTFNNMSFAIPSNLVLDIVKTLEKGVRPQRALLGVSIVDVFDYQQDKEHFLEIYPFLQIPDDLKYGFYVIEITPGGVCYKANVLKNDIIISFNGVKLKYSYQIRAELGKFIVGSGEKTTMEVLRDGKLITLDIVF